MRSFLRQVTDGLRDYLRGQDLPMVLVGLDGTVAAYRDLDGYAHVIDEVVRRNPTSSPPKTFTPWPGR